MHLKRKKKTPTLQSNIEPLWRFFVSFPQNEDINLESLAKTQGWLKWSASKKCSVSFSFTWSSSEGLFNLQNESQL